MADRCMESPIGALWLREEAGEITRLSFERPQQVALESSPLLEEAVQQLEAYFAGRRQAFTLPLCPAGTDFQRQVWAQLQAIPYGQTRTYRQIAQAIGNPRACRAVGMANHRNPIAILIPCHRVIGADGTLTGYAGGLKAKEWLLQLEQKGMER